MNQTTTRSPARKTPNKTSFVKWSDLSIDDWKLLANALDVEFPDRQFSTASTLDLNCTEFNSILERTLPDGRRPPKLVSMVKVKPVLMSTFKLMRESSQGNEIAAIQRAPEASQQLVNPSAADSANEGETSLSNNSEQHAQATLPDMPPIAEKLTVPARPASVIDMTGGSQKSKVFLKSADWYEIALKLEQQNPHSGYAHSGSLAGLSAADINRAIASAMPPEKHRTIVSLKEPREKLLEAFKVINAERTLAAKQANDLKAVEGRVKAPTPEAQSDATEAASASTPAANNPWEAAFAPIFAPIIKLIADQVAVAIKPQIEEHIKQVIAAATPDLHQQVVERINASMSPEARKPLVGVVGTLPEQANKLQEAFPDLNLVCVETDQHNRVRSLQNCRRVFGMVKFMSHSMESSVKKIAKDRYVRVDGGPESVRRQIEISMRSGAFAHH